MVQLTCILRLTSYEQFGARYLVIIVSSALLHRGALFPCVRPYILKLKVNILSGYAEVHEAHLCRETDHIRSLPFGILSVDISQLITTLRQKQFLA